jgi:hypothetical protein
LEARKALIKREKKEFKGRMLFFVMMAIIVVASFIGSAVQSSWGQVQIRTIKIPTQSGQWVAADLFKPRSATADTPAPSRELARDRMADSHDLQASAKACQADLGGRKP